MKEIGVSRRTLLGSIGVKSVSFGFIGSTSAEKDLGIKVEEATGFQRRYAVMEARRNPEWQKVEQEMKGNGVQLKVKSATVTVVTEENGDQRHVVSIPCRPEQGNNTEEREIFIQSSGLHQLREIPEYFSDELSNVRGYDITVDQNRLLSKVYTSNEDNDIIVDSHSVDRSVNLSGEDSVWYPAPPSGECDNCKVTTGTDCAPSSECLGRIVSIVGGTWTCVACAYAPSWYNPACVGCALAGIAQGLLGSIDCLGCNDVIDVCITDEYADSVCP